MKKLLKTMALLGAGLAFLPTVQAQSAAESSTAEGITIVIPVSAAPGKTRAEVNQAVQSIAAIVRKQPGLLEDRLLMNKNIANRPNYVHVLRWRQQKDWEAVFGAPEFQKALTANASVISVDGASIFVPFKP